MSHYGIAHIHIPMSKNHIMGDIVPCQHTFLAHICTCQVQINWFHQKDCLDTLFDMAGLHLVSVAPSIVISQVYLVEAFKSMNSSSSESHVE